MGLSCSCNSGGGDGYDWIYTYSLPLDFKPLSTKRAHRCCSCKRLVKPGEDIVELERYRYARGEVEERIYGEGCDVSMASWVLCEECGGLFMSINDLGICWTAGSNIKEDIRDWAESQHYYRSKHKIELKQLHHNTKGIES